jgi:outer membrane protein insertion porin family
MRPLALALFCALPLLASTPPGGTIVRSVEVTGTHARSERDVLSLLGTAPSAVFSPGQLRSDLAAVAAAYRADGYYFADAAVDTLLFAADSSWVSVAISVREGERYVVGSIAIDGAAAVSAEEMRRVMETREGAVLDPAVVGEDAARILSLYDRRGYPFAAVRVGSVDVRGREPLLDVRLAVDEGARVMLRDVRIEGNTATRPEVILRETRLHLPELYDEERLARIGDRLRRLNLFASVAEPELFMTDSGGVLVLRVDEGNTSTFDGVVGYAPAPAAGGDGVLAGSVTLDVRNMFGTARVLGIRWQRDDRSSQDIRLQYVEPWAFGLPVNLGGTFQQRQQDSSYLRRSVGARADLLLTESFTVAGSVRHDVTIPSAGAGPAPVENSRTLTAGLEILLDSRNDNISPTSGVLYRTEYRAGSKKSFGASAAAGPSALQQVGLDLQWFVQTFPRNVVMAGVHGRQVTNSRLEVSDLFRFGGTNTLRGYRELQFVGSRVAWTNLEYRVLLARRSFCYGFFDTGYYALPEDAVLGTASAQSVKYGYGVGLRMETGLGNVGVSFALGEGDNLSQGKIHFGLMNEF